MLKYSDFARSRPLSPAVLGELEAFQGVTPPTDELDPHAAWEQTYRIWAVFNSPQSANMGYLDIQRKPDPDKRLVNLTVEKVLGLAGGMVYRSKAEIECADDALSSLRGWRLESVILDPDKGEEIPATRVQQTAVRKNGKVEVTTNGRMMARELPSALTSDWGLFDVVQRLPGDKTEPLEFAMLEELDMLKDGQRLSYREAQDIKFGDQTVRCWRYQQLGHGILPYEYWVDEKHHLLISTSHTRVYILDPKIRQQWANRLGGRGRA